MTLLAWCWVFLVVVRCGGAGIVGVHRHYHYSRCWCYSMCLPLEQSLKNECDSRKKERNEHKTKY